MLLKWLGYYNGKVTIYTGMGYKQGIGFDIETEEFRIDLFGIRVIKSINIQTESQWLEKLKDKLKV